jgi:hypothetical protein
MGNIFKIHRDEKGIAKWDTFQQRFAFAFGVVSFMVLAPIIVLSFAWLFYWLVTGKNIFTNLLK